MKKLERKLEKNKGNNILSFYIITIIFLALANFSLIIFFLQYHSKKKTAKQTISQIRTMLFRSRRPSPWKGYSLAGNRFSRR